MKCWICGAEADTGEHRTKASDLRAIFGRVHQHRPLYIHDAEQRNKVVPGLRSSALVFGALLCAECNNETTQPYDRAWEKLSKYLRNRSPLRRSQLICLQRVFPGAVKRSLLDVHLYFLKLFGCLIQEHGIPIDITEFSAAIQNRRPHQHVFLALSSYADGVRSAGYSDLNVVMLDGRAAFAVWLYVLESFSVRVMYALPGERRQGLVGAWHPNSVSKCIRVT